MDRPQAPPIDYSRRYTLEEYLALEEQSPIKHEYWDGEMVPKYADGPHAMAGTTAHHNLIVLNAATALRTRLRDAGCRTVASEMQLAVGNQVTYPDVMTSCHPADLSATTRWHSPTLIIEVLSNSTQHHDRHWKLAQYRQLPSLQQYVLVSQYRILVESYTRQSDDTWMVTSYTEATAELAVPSLNLRIPISELYDEVTLGPLCVWRERGEE